MPLRNNRTRSYIFAGIQALIALGTAVLLPLIFFQSAAAAAAFPPSSRIIISILAGMVVLLTPLPALLAQSLLEQRQVAERVEEGQRRSGRVELLTGDLLRIQSALVHAATIDRSNLFLKLIGQQVGQLAEDVEECARKKTLTLRPTILMTEPIFDGLDAHDELEFFHYADNHDWVLEVGGHSLDIQDKLLQRIRTGKLASVSRIIVVGSPYETADTRTLTYCLFHDDTPGYDYKIISRSTFDRKRVDTGVRLQRVDVGIYGRNYVYISHQSPTAADELDRVAPRGILSADQSAIDTYRLLFREAWGAGDHLPPAVLNILKQQLRTADKSSPTANDWSLDDVRKLQAALQQQIPQMHELVRDNERVRMEFEAFMRSLFPPTH
jgi:hypothetical protein